MSKASARKGAHRRLIGAITSGRRRRERGFTLIELLVVIVILGILAGVVVFAVRGAGDKGLANAKASDRRTIRTAQEAFCARFGRYGTEGQLLGLEDAPDGKRHKFLASPPVYNRINAVEKNGGPCNGWSYTLDGTGGGSDEGPPAGPTGWVPTNYWPAGNDAEGNWIEALVPLADGRIYAQGRRKIGLYNPANEEWALAPLAPLDETSGPTGAALIADDPHTEGNQCGTNCGKVLVHLLGYFSLFDPAAASDAWKVYPRDVSYSADAYFVNGVVPLGGGPEKCGSHCGKLFSTGYEDSDPRTPTADLYDPVTESFTPVSYPAFREKELARLSSLTPLNDGRVLIVGYAGSGVTPADWRAVIFDPVNSTFTDAAPPPGGVAVKAAVIPNGDVVFVSLGATKIYRPAARGGGPGAWRVGAGCVTTPKSGCVILGSLVDGRVMARVFEVGTSGNTPLAATRIFLPATETWTDAGDMNNATTGQAGAMIDPSRGGCGPNCGKFLAAGRGTAELYTAPPAP